MIELRVGRALLTFAALAAAHGPATAQTTLFDFHGEAFADTFGHSVAGAGDVDGDGRADLIVGSRHDGGAGVDAGRAYVLSGADGALLHTFDGAAAQDWFGYSVAGAGDVNGDGFDDVIVGAPYEDAGTPNAGTARVFSGVDGAVLHELHGPTTYAFFGQSVAGAGDVDGDGLADVIVGAPWIDRATVFSGADGRVLHAIQGAAGDDFGYAVSGAGDVDCDGFEDVVVGAPRTGHFDQTGSAYVCSGRTGATLHAIHGTGPAWVWFGASVAGAGDVDGDGCGDVIVGAPVHELIHDEGGAQVHSGRDGKLLHSFLASGDHDMYFGWSVAAAGDVDGDGFDDVIVDVRDDAYLAHSPGGARVYSGRDGLALFTFGGDAAGDMLGRSVHGAGDVNGDGRPDLVVGAPGHDAAAPAAGLARVVACCDFLGELLCSPAVANSTGTPGTLSANGSASIADDDFTLTAASLPAGTTGAFLASTRTALVHGAFGGTGVLCLGGPLVRIGPAVEDVSGSGRLALSVDLPPSALPGSTWYFQCLYRDADPGPTSNLTEALELTFE